MENRIEVVYKTLGKKIPVDHGFALYGAISRILPFFHQDPTAGIRLVRGRFIGEGLLDISPFSELVLRIPVSNIPKYIPLSGKSLMIGEYRLRIGVPMVRSIVPAVSLYAHLVTTKNGHNQNRFENEITHQIETMNIHGKIDLGKRRTFKIHDKQVVGYTVLVSGLTAKESMRLQENGIGGRRKMGCGFFEPVKGVK